MAVRDTTRTENVCKRLHTKSLFRRGDTMTLTETQWTQFYVILNDAHRSELDTIRDRVNHEIRLSETAIAEKMEERK